MAKIAPILSIASRVLLGLVMVSALVLNLGMAYIMFMPDTYPKPFYLLSSAVPGNSSPTIIQQYIPVNTTSENSSIEPGEETTAEAAETEPGQGIMLNTGTKIVNLADTTKSRYIRTTIVMEFALPETEATDEEAAAAAEGEETVTAEDAFIEELNQVLPLIDDTIVTTLSTKTYEDLYTADGKELLRTELMGSVQTKLPQYTLISVYFTEFVVE